MQNTWFSSDDLTNFIINKNITNKCLITDAYDIKTDLCFFSHVPKTGGTSLESIFAKNYAPSELLHINAPDLNRLPQIIDVKKSPPRFICGHHPFHGLLYQLIQQRRLFQFTMLRNPIDRVVSYFNYVKGKQDHPMHPHTNNNLDQFLSASPSPELINGQSRRFSGYLHASTASDETLLHEAKAVLSQCFSLVLTTCLFDQGLLLLKKHLGLNDIYYMRHNQSTKFVDKSELSDASLNWIMEHNSADMVLFDWARLACEKRIQNELSLHSINEFKTNNLKWRQLINAQYMTE